MFIFVIQVLSLIEMIVSLGSTILFFYHMILQSAQGMNFTIFAPVPSSVIDIPAETQYNRSFELFPDPFVLMDIFPAVA